MFAIIVARKQHSKKSKPSKHLKGSANIPGPAQPLFLTVVLILPNRAFSIFCHLEPRVMEFLMILSIQGTGTVNGQGFDWWSPSSVYFIQKKSKHIPDMKPTALRFYASYNVTVQDIEIVNSPQCHLKFDNSKRIKNTQDVEIQHSSIGSGDDCISIQTGCSNIHVHHINCGPGHGISVGGLGKDKSVACVSNIVVEKVSLQNTLAGARIKTWQGGIGSVKNISFSNIQVSNVKYPIIIDQFYCDKHICENQTEAVQFLVLDMIK
ncbi:hypothetical protein GH714_028261 [Hevea brasiliensis]|uniref:Polygalacturonase n=1 Tax=Hevea brasiliensis TaxID=3981 RepID=A0A6A6KXL6_HEVBR|nr:hypothetical protein GH714_028261 [Hevea brasiliensis]